MSFAPNQGNSGQFAKHPSGSPNALHWNGVRRFHPLPDEEWMLVNSDQSTHPLDNAAMLRESEGVCVENGIGRNFHFAFPAMTVYCRLPLLRSFSAFLPEPKNRTRPAGPLPEPKGHDFPHFEAISQTPLPQLPSVVLVGFAWLPRLSGRQRQSQNPPQHACEQAPRQMALCQQHQ